VTSPPPPSEGQIKQAFRDAMPPTWKEQFVHANLALSNQTTVQVVHYFRSQENQMLKHQKENTHAMLRVFFVLQGNQCHFQSSASRKSLFFLCSQSRYQ
jgi:hypothetical protein